MPITIMRMMYKREKRPWGYIKAIVSASVLTMLVVHAPSAQGQSLRGLFRDDELYNGGLPMLMYFVVPLMIFKLCEIVQHFLMLNIVSSAFPFHAGVLYHTNIVINQIASVKEHAEVEQVEEWSVDLMERMFWSSGQMFAAFISRLLNETEWVAIPFCEDPMSLQDALRNGKIPKETRDILVETLSDALVQSARWQERKPAWWHLECLLFRREIARGFLIQPEFGEEIRYLWTKQLGKEYPLYSKQLGVSRAIKMSETN